MEKLTVILPKKPTPEQRNKHLANLSPGNQRLVKIMAEGYIKMILNLHDHPNHIDINKNGNL